MKLSPLAVLLVSSLAAAADPLRYVSSSGDQVSYNASLRSETVVRRGQTVERFGWIRSGTQRVVACAAESGRVLYSVEIDHGPARATAYTVDGEDRLKTDADRLASMLPGAESSLEFLWLDDRGRGAVGPRDASLEAAILCALDDVEVLPEGDEPAWERSGSVGPVGWKAKYTRSGGTVKGVFTFAAPERGGARVAFDPGSAELSMVGGSARSIECRASWTVATKDGTERREIRFLLTGKSAGTLSAEEAADAAADAAPMISAQEAWRDGERDRALELWDKVAGDAGNRWAARAGSQAKQARADAPMLGQSAPPLKATSWIGAAPEAGKWQLVYFWATWAPRCEGELAGLAGLLKGRSRVAGAAVTRADALQSEEAIRSAASRLSLPFGVGLDDGSLTKGFKVEALPRVFLVDPDGKVRFEGEGNEVETLKAVIEKLAGE